MESNYQKSSATILASQMELIETFPKNQQLSILKALINYELKGIEPDPSIFKRNKSLETFWLMSVPLIDKRVKRAENGRNGGLAKGENSKRKAKNSKPIAKNSKPIADKDKDKEKDMDKDYPSPSGETLGTSPEVEGGYEWVDASFYLRGSDE